MKVVLIILSLVAYNIQAIGQDLIILRNADEIEGKVIEVLDNEIKYKKKSNPDGPLYSIDKDFIFMVKYENGQKDVFNAEKVEPKEPDKEFKFKKRGFTNITELTTGIGISTTSEEFSYGFSTVNGYLVNPHFSVGFGVGIDKYEDFLAVPLFVDLRANFLKYRVTPIFSVGVGYSIPIWQKNGSSSDLRGGVFVNPAIGAKFFVSQKTSLFLTLGYRLQEIETPVYGSYYRDRGAGSSFWVTTRDGWAKMSMNMITIKFGATF